MKTSKLRQAASRRNSGPGEIKHIEEIVERITEEYLRKREESKQSNEEKDNEVQIQSFQAKRSVSKSVELQEHKRSQTTASGILKSHISDFCSNISLPGFRYVGEPGRHSLDRYVWFLVLTISVFVSSKYIQDSYRKWQQSPVLLSFNDSMTSISAIPFPTVTLCPARQIGSHYDLEAALQQCQDNCQPHQWNKLLAAGLLCPKSTRFSKEMDAKYFNGSVGHLIKEIASTCGEDMTWYKLNGDEYSYNCSLRFQTLFLDGSVCFSFNMLPAKDLFHQYVVSTLVDRTEVVTKPDWTLDTMLQSADDLSASVPRYISSNGRWAGLYFNVERTTEIKRDICGQPRTNTQIVFHHSGEIPTPETHKFYDLPSRGDLFILVLPRMVTASQELRDYHPDKRKCFFSHERHLSLFRMYTQRNCQLECRVNCSLSLCDCVPFYLPRPNNTVKICGRQHTIDCAELYLSAILGGRYSWREIVLNYRQWVGDRIQEQFRGYEYSRGGALSGPRNLTEELLRATYPDCICDCPTDCTSLHYDVEIHQQPLPDFFSVGSKITRPAISFKELEFTSVIRKELIGLTDFIANSGGVLGVFTGFSFLALVELLYYLTLRLWKNIKHSWEEASSHNDIATPQASASAEADIATPQASASIIEQLTYI